MIHKDFPAYSVSTSGAVTNTKTGRTLRPELTQNGYYRVTLCCDGGKKRFLLHRLVAILYIENAENKPCVNHIDGDKANNSVSNLEWCTFSENERHSYGELGKVVPNGIDHYNAKLTDDQCRRAVILRRSGFSCRKIAAILGVSHQHISEITRGLKRADATA